VAFGRALVPGNFNGDGYTDLAVSASVPITDEYRGEVYILFGSPNGVTENNAQVFNQALGTISIGDHPGGQFGREMEAGDFNGDGRDDLAIAKPFADNEALGNEQEGVVIIMYGNDSGLRTDNELLISLGSPGVGASPQERAYFGDTLEAADFNGDGKDDLAVGSPGYGYDDGLDSPTWAGMVMVFDGATTGLSILSGTMWRQGYDGIQGAHEPGDRFGSGLTSGDIDQNGVADLVVGSDESVVYGGKDFHTAGAVNIIYGFLVSNGLSSAGNQMIYPGQPGVWLKPDVGSRFGRSIKMADFNGDGDDDLIIGAYDFEVDDELDLEGVVMVFLSNGNVLTMAGQQLLMAEMLIGENGSYSNYGRYVNNAADFNQDGFADVAVSMTSGASNQFHLLYGTGSGLSVVDSHICQRVVSESHYSC
ncbi:MAG: FG-GAP repeat protein, partial [Chloroflexota bacterium]